MSDCFVTMPVIILFDKFRNIMFRLSFVVSLKYLLLSIHVQPVFRCSIIIIKIID